MTKLSDLVPVGSDNERIATRRRSERLSSTYATSAARLSIGASYVSHLAPTALPRAA